MAINHPICRAEELLLDMGVVHQRSPQRRSVLGCLGCKWLGSDNPDDVEPVLKWEIIDCADIKHQAAGRFFMSLEQSGVIASEVIHGEPGEGQPVKFYFPSDTEAGQEFLARLEPPESCPNV